MKCASLSSWQKHQTDLFLEGNLTKFHLPSCPYLSRDSNWLPLLNNNTFFNIKSTPTPHPPDAPCLCCLQAFLYQTHFLSTPGLRPDDRTDLWSNKQQTRFCQRLSLNSPLPLWPLTQPATSSTSSTQTQVLFVDVYAATRITSCQRSPRLNTDKKAER